MINKALDQAPFPKARYLILLIVGASIASSIILSALPVRENIYWLLNYLLDSIYLILILSYLKKKKIFLFDLTLVLPKKILLKTILLMFFSLLFALGTISFVSLLLPETYYDESVPDLVQLDPLYLAFVGFFSIVLLAPLWEEIIFRGLILNRWMQKWSKTRAILLSSLLFALLHPLDGIGAFIFSIILAIQYLRTKNLLLAIAGHSFYNFVLFIFFVSGSLAGWGEAPLEIPNASETLIFGSICIAISLPILAYWLKKNWPKATE